MSQCKKNSAVIPGLGIVVVALALAANAHAQPFSDFEVGWTKVEPFGGKLLVYTTGGNPGGFLVATDTVGGGGGLRVKGPAAFSGDLSVYTGIHWDEFVFNHGPNNHSPSWPVLFGAGGTVFSHRAPLGPVGVWRSRAVSFDASEWTWVQGTDSFPDVLQNATLGFQLEGSSSVAGPEIGIDNVLLVPGPAIDCNSNGIPDADDIAQGTSADQNANGVPDECEGNIVRLDIRPGSCPNPLNRGSHGVLPAALLGAADFDATTIDVSSVRLSRVDGVGGEVAPNEGPPGPHSVFEDVGTPFEGQPCDCHNLTGDGFLDLVMRFRTDDVVEALELNNLEPGALVELVVSGSLLDGTSFTSAGDCVRLVPPGTPTVRVFVSSNVSGLFIDVTPVDVVSDGGGFADFERTHLTGSTVTVTAPALPEPPLVNGRSFVGWKVNGVMQDSAVPTLQVLLDRNTTLRAVYQYGGIGSLSDILPAPQYPAKGRDPVESFAPQ